MPKIAILTSFNEMRPGYSLTGIVSDQIAMLIRHGHQVQLFVQEGFNQETYPGPGEALAVVPFAHLLDYQSKNDLTPPHEITVADTARVLAEHLAGFDLVFTHDWLFTGWNLPYALGLIDAARDLEGLAWWHWIHSIPSNMRDWWDIKTLGPAHRLVYPNKTDALRLAEQFRGTLDDVLVIPHIKDLRSWFGFGEDTNGFLDRYPTVMSADILQVLPAASDRFAAKGLDEVIKIFAAFKRRGLKVCLIVANQWATPGPWKAETRKYLETAQTTGLKPAEEIIFTSEYAPEFEIGLPQRMLRELFQCANLFIFPTREESFGLVMPEAVLAGGVLPVLNRSLTMQNEISGGQALYFDFGSYTHHFDPPDKDRYLEEVATVILGRMEQNEALMTKTFIRQKLNWDYIYHHAYEPAMNGVLLKSQGI